MFEMTTEALDCIDSGVVMKVLEQNVVNKKIKDKSGLKADRIKLYLLKSQQS